jgi:hypothetical protein
LTQINLLEIDLEKEVARYTHFVINIIEISLERPYNTTTNSSEIEL